MSSTLGFSGVWKLKGREWICSKCIVYKHEFFKELVKMLFKDNSITSETVWNLYRYPIFMTRFWGWESNWKVVCLFKRMEMGFLLCTFWHTTLSDAPKDREIHINREAYSEIVLEQMLHHHLICLLLSTSTRMELSHCTFKWVNERCAHSISSATLLVNGVFLFVRPQGPT